MENYQFSDNVQSNPEIRDLAKSQLTNKWTIPVVTALAYVVLTMIIDTIPIPGMDIDTTDFFSNWFGTDLTDKPGFEDLQGEMSVKIPILTFLVSGPLAIGLCVFHLNFVKNGQAELPDIFQGFKQFIQAILAGFLVGIIVLVGFAFLVVPGVIASLGLSQTYYIMADKPGTKAIDAMKESWEMMKGYKGKLLLLSLSFIPWAILSVFTCFIGYLWLMPYMYVSFSNFYLQRRGEALELGLEDHLIVGE